jgi:hypothetical protein
MLKRWQRVVLDKTNVQTDISLLAQNGTGFDFDLTGGSDFLYVGQYYPFNNLYFSMSGGGGNPSHDPTGLTVQYWTGSSWQDAVDLIDDTDCFHESGVLQWSPDKNEGWTRISDTSEETNFDLSAFNIYDLYWMRIGLDNGHYHSSLDCKLIAYKFCQHADLAKFDPEINEYLIPWGGASKTTWDEQILTASESVIAELKQRGLVLHQGQVLRFDDVYEATVYKTLMTIYAQLGPSFVSKFDAAKEEYISRMSTKRWSFDMNQDGQANLGEIDNSVSEFER